MDSWRTVVVWQAKCCKIQCYIFHSIFSIIYWKQTFFQMVASGGTRQHHLVPVFERNLPWSMSNPHIKFEVNRSTVFRWWYLVAPDGILCGQTTKRSLTLLREHTKRSLKHIIYEQTIKCSLNYTQRNLTNAHKCIFYVGKPQNAHSP